MKKLRYVYHIVYLTENNIYGSCILYRQIKINTEIQVCEAASFISNEYCNGKKVIILNFQLLNKRGK